MREVFGTILWQTLSCFSGKSMWLLRRGKLFTPQNIIAPSRQDLTLLAIKLYQQAHEVLA